MKSQDIYLKGEALYGDDFSDEDLKKWFREEYNAYSDSLGDIKSYDYAFFAIDQLCGFKYVKDNGLNCLGIGSANGEEFKPIWSQINQLTILENSDKYKDMLIDNKKIIYLYANYKGVIDAPDNNFDLVVSFSCLHHIANVSFVLVEIYRVLKKGGLALIREPIISMGDWRYPRPGLSKNERGIPIKIFRDIINNLGFTIIAETLWNFRPFGKMLFFYKKSIFNNLLLTKIDLFLSKLFKFNINYYPYRFIHRFCPSNVFFVLRK